MSHEFRGRKTQIIYIFSILKCGNSVTLVYLELVASLFSSPAHKIFFSWLITTDQIWTSLLQRPLWKIVPQILASRCLWSVYGKEIWRRMRFNGRPEVRHYIFQHSMRSFETGLNVSIRTSCKISQWKSGQLSVDGSVTGFRFNGYGVYAKFLLREEV